MFQTLKPLPAEFVETAMSPRMSISLLPRPSKLRLASFLRFLLVVLASTLAAQGTPSQWLLFAHPKHGVTSEHEVHLGE